MQLILVLLSALAPVAVALWYIFKKDIQTESAKKLGRNKDNVFSVRNNNCSKMFSV